MALGVAAAVYVAGRLHQPDYAFSMFGADPIPPKSLLATIALGLAGGPGAALFDLSCSWVEGIRCELAAFGHSRDGKRGKQQIEYGLITARDGCPVAVRVFAGNTGDPKAFTEAVEMVRGKFGITEAVMVGDRGMITSTRITALKELAGMAWITCLRAPAIRKLAEDGELADEPVRHPGPGRDQPPGLPRGAAYRLPQPGAGSRARRAPPAAAGRHRGRARQDPEPGRSRAAH